MGMSQDWDLDAVIAHSRTLNVDSDLAVKKYYEIYRHLRTFDEYKFDEYKRIEASVVRTKNWLSAYATMKSLDKKS